MFYAVFEDHYMYVKGIYSDAEYEKSFGHLRAEYQPRCESFDTRSDAEQYMAEQNQRARQQYSAG